MGAAIACALLLPALPALAGTGVDWTIDVDPADPAEPVSRALLGHYDLSGQLLAYDQVAGLAPAMSAVGFSNWRVGVGRWENSTWLLPALTDGTPCPIVIPGSAAPSGATDLDLIAARDWFTDDGAPVSQNDTEDDGRYALDYLRSVLDVVDAFGAEPFVSIDSMPRALAVNRTPLRTDCGWTFQNSISNVRPQDATVFAAAVTGLVQRIVEGSGAAPARAVRYWEIWNEPEFAPFWDPAYEDLGGALDRWFEMAISSLVALDAYRAASPHPNAEDLRFGVGSFGVPAVAAVTLAGFDDAPFPGGFVPLDFVSFHAYANDPLEVVDAIDTVAAAATGTVHYRDIELVLAEWGPDLGSSAGDPVYAASIEPALHIATVLALGAAAGLDRAHRALFWDFFPSSIRLGLLDHDLQPRPAYRAYELLSRTIAEGALRLAPEGLADGRLDGGAGAVLATLAPDGTTRVLLVNRGAASRSARILLGGVPVTPTRVLRYDDPSTAIALEAGTSPDVVVPARSLVLLELAPARVPATGGAPRVLLVVGLLALGLIPLGLATRRARARARRRYSR